MSTHLRPRTGNASSPTRPNTAYSTCSTIRRVTPSLESLTTALESNYAEHSTPQRNSQDMPRPSAPTPAAGLRPEAPPMPASNTAPRLRSNPVHLESDMSAKKRTPGGLLSFMRSSSHRPSPSPPRESYVLPTSTLRSSYMERFDNIHRPITPSPMTDRQRETQFKPLRPSTDSIDRLEEVVDEALAQDPDHPVMKRFAYLRGKELKAAVGEYIMSGAVSKEIRDSFVAHEKLKKETQKRRNIKKTPQHERMAFRKRNSNPLPEFAYPLPEGVELELLPERSSSVASSYNSPSHTPAYAKEAGSIAVKQSPTQGAGSVIANSNHSPEPDNSDYQDLGPTAGPKPAKNHNSLRINVPRPCTRPGSPKIAVHGPLFSTLESEAPGRNREGPLRGDEEKKEDSGDKQKTEKMTKKGRKEGKKENECGGCGCGCLVM
ncbi:hypothetical protein K504DRAFT_497748 [Pleomassaria siparia CBS 279.74]|uniref:Uncharacterized protein n=1 Tax=Pleomassaria siparia CBS 279.74 TaxID=1314801 RepID=A0A6G1KKA0_9PLEO|nr:hypothetical protein K504DRAFT_497748 [Pleomassaria siparia CBS 279.74]